ncbi:MAG: phosphoglycerate dehydrogenase [Xanthomonadaceae bacterium]|nr:phosphoglycerate dehydrogenase [Xanthomonadaceae bacterium]MDE1884282.1 phosphoglycerate dehydrogenase [Xanthomonadaceae bacterium]MDE1961408.1 phosphoglycerate dehydrogenase [Xanthomonadaceae bacterium]MDE2084613.1 phosphoglycerate dehydrogenase [Xanthomonadaceae bacterium]MDE2256781.1 phosphoglycerate dehydrogenase [Xanthomonadaceae bacterium]
MFKIQTLNNISRNGLDRLPANLYSVANDVTEPDALLLRSADLQGKPLSASIKAVARAGAGTNNIPVAEFSQRGVPVFNAPGANANAVKELVVAGMLIAARNLDGALAFVGGLNTGDDLHHKVEAEKKRFVGTELAGKTLGVVGLGAIGVKVANAARALGMRVLGFDPHMTVDGAWALSSEVARAGSLNELYAASDYITFHVPLNDATRGVFGTAALDRVRPGTVLLNFAREGIVDAATLAQGLADGRIGRYVTDFPSAELIGNARVIGLPHLGASTGEAEENCAVMVVDQLRDFLENGNVHNAVNFPNTRMARAGRARLCIANRNRPNMIGQLSHVLGEAGVNIAQMHNASRGDIAYTLIDLDSVASDALVAAIGKIDGILSVRALA